MSCRKECHGRICYLVHVAGTEDLAAGVLASILHQLFPHCIQQATNQET